MTLADPTKVQVIHILKDGTVLDDITGHVVRLEDETVLRRVILSVSAKKMEATKNA